MVFVALLLTTSTTLFPTSSTEIVSKNLAEEHFQLLPRQRPFQSNERVSGSFIIILRIIIDINTILCAIPPIPFSEMSMFSSPFLRIFAWRVKKTLTLRHIRPKEIHCAVLLISYRGYTGLCLFRRGAHASQVVRWIYLKGQRPDWQWIRITINSKREFTMYRTNWCYDYLRLCGLRSQ